MGDLSLYTIGKVNTPQEVQATQDTHDATLASIGQTQAQTQGLNLANTQAAQVNPLQLEQQKLTIGAQLASSIQDQKSLDNVRQTYGKLGLDSSQLPTSYDPITGPIQAQAMANKYYLLSGHLGDMLKIKELQQNQQKINNDSVAAAAASHNQKTTTDGNGNTTIEGQPASLLGQPASVAAQPMNVSIPVGQPVPQSGSPALPGGQAPDPNAPIPGMGGMTGAQVQGAAAQMANGQSSPAQQVATDVQAATPTASGLSPAAQAIQNQMDAVKNSNMTLEGQGKAIDVIKSTPQYAQYQIEKDAKNAENQQIATDAGKTLDEYRQGSDAAGTALLNLRQIASDTNGFTMGTGAGAKLAASKGILSIYQNLGIKPPAGLADGIASQEGLNKGALQVSLAALEQTGEKSAAALSAVKAGLPHDTMTQAGFNLINAGLTGAQQYKQAQYMAASAAVDAKQPLATFPAKFQSSISPMTFAFNNMTPANRNTFIQNTLAQPGGRAYIALLQKQIDYAQHQPWGAQFGFNPPQGGQ